MDAAGRKTTLVDDELERSISLSARDDPGPEEGSQTNRIPSPLPLRKSTRSTTRAQAPLEVTQTAVPKKTLPKRAMWNDRRIYTRPNSPLVKVDIAKMLATEEAWEVLSPEEKKTLVDMLPKSGSICVQEYEGQLSLDHHLLRENTNFKNDCKMYRQNIKDSRHTVASLQQGWNAHLQRMAGAFDEFVDDEFEKLWDMKIPESIRFRRLSGDRSTNLPKEATLHSIQKDADQPPEALSKFAHCSTKEKSEQQRQDTTEGNSSCDEPGRVEGEESRKSIESKDQQPSDTLPVSQNNDTKGRIKGAKRKVAAEPVSPPTNKMARSSPTSTHMAGGTDRAVDDSQDELA